jgi:hypothetical protein
MVNKFESGGSVSSSKVYEIVQALWAIKLVASCTCISQIV